MVKKNSIETLEYYEKWTHSEDKAFHTTSKTENSKKVIFIMKV